MSDTERLRLASHVSRDSRYLLRDPVAGQQIIDARPAAPRRRKTSTRSRPGSASRTATPAAPPRPACSASTSSPPARLLSIFADPADQEKRRPRHEQHDPEPATILPVPLTSIVPRSPGPSATTRSPPAMTASGDQPADDLAGDGLQEVHAHANCYPIVPAGRVGYKRRPILATDGSDRADYDMSRRCSGVLTIDPPDCPMIRRRMYRPGQGQALRLSRRAGASPGST